MEKRKVLFITRKFPPETGGMENLCFHVAEFLPNEEFEVNVVALGKKQIHLIWFFPYALLYVFFHARKYDYLLIGDGLMCMCGSVCGWFSHKVKRMIILHGLDITFKSPLYQAYIKLFLKNSSDLYICNSNNTRKILEEWGIQEKTTVITPGINIEAFAEENTYASTEFRKKYVIPEDHLILITVGRLIKRKGVAWFVEHVMPRLHNVTYLVIGEGGERNEILAKINENNLEENVRLLGRISDEDWKQCYQNADVFVMPNIHVEDDVEGFGIVAAEASLAGLIVVAANMDGIPDAIQDGKNGILVDSENPDAFYHILQDIQINLEKYKEATKEYFVFTKEHYSWDSICDAYRREMKQLGFEGEQTNE